MKQIINNPIWKSLFVICLLVATMLLFRFINNQTIKTLIGIVGFILMLYSYTKKKKSTTQL